MCGLFGFTKFDTDQLTKGRDSLHELQHRGPDQWSDYYDDKIYMGHQRLSILDLSDNGKQPMVSKNEKVIITVNGEIYNFQKLKRELENKYEFQSKSDSEVVLYGYIEWGIELLLNRIDGMYSICIYDKEKKKLFLVRDRTGIKPLYYSTLNDQLSWASELKAIQKYFEDSDILEYDYTALYDFLTYRYIPAPKSQFKNVYKLEPAHYLKIDLDSDKIEKIQYWQLIVNNSKDDAITAQKNIYNLVKTSVNEQMIADVSVGFFLSGGMDSSTVVALASETYKKINTFSIGFLEKEHDETYFADIIAEKFKTKHFKKFLKEDEVDHIFDKIKDWYDEPFADTSCFPTYLISKFAKRRTTVVLTGDGGDEIFGGYNWYKTFEKAHSSLLKHFRILRPIAERLGSRNSKMGNLFRKLSIIFTVDDVEKYAVIRGSLSKHQKEKYRVAWGIGKEYDDFWYYRKFYKKNLDLYTRLQYVDFHTYLPDDILTKVDRVSMAVSLECRVPFLKKELIEYCFSLDSKVRLYNKELKGIMKLAFSDILPYDITHRSKRGFSIPLKKWNTLLKNKKTKQEKILSDFDIYVQ